MKKPTKVILGIATLWPLVYILIFMGFWFYIMFRVFQHPRDGNGEPTGMIVIFILHGVTMLWMGMLLIIYIVNLFKNDRVNKDIKVLWALVLFFGGPLAMPIYWYLYIWPEPGKTEPTGTPPEEAVGMPK